MSESVRKNMDTCPSCGYERECLLCTAKDEKISALTRELEIEKGQHSFTLKELTFTLKENARLREALLELKHQSHHTIAEEMWRIDAALSKGCEEPKIMREKLSALCHEQWSGWMRWMIPKVESGAGAIQRKEWIERWKRQMNTPYSELSEKEKDSDRKEADKILNLISGYNQHGEGGKK